MCDCYLKRFKTNPAEKKHKKQIIIYFYFQIVILYYRVVVFSGPLQGHVLHCKGCCGLVHSSYRETVHERLRPQPLAVLLIS